MKNVKIIRADITADVHPMVIMRTSINQHAHIARTFAQISMSHIQGNALKNQVWLTFYRDAK